MALSVCSELSSGKIGVTISLDNDGFPAPNALSIRVPHPDGKKAVRVSAGQYDPDSETVTLAPFSGELYLDVFF